MPELPSYGAAAAVLATDLFWDVKGTATYKATGKQIKDYSVNPIPTTYADLLALQVGSTLGSGYRYFISLPTVTWNVASTYNLNDEVNDGAGNYYKSIQAANLANLVTDTTWWKQVYRGITLVANDVNVLDMHAEINISSVTNFILFDFTNDNVLAYSADVINNYYLLDSNTTTVGTTAVITEETLATYTMPADTLAVDGDIIEIRASGSFAANGNNKQLKVKIGTTTILDTTASAQNNLTWNIIVLIYRIGSASQKYTSKADGSSAAGIGWQPVVSKKSISTSTEDLTTSLALAVTGQNGTATANDIVLETFDITHSKA